jgi:Outer membrane protein and related peptidoglycan-associated (lipo)proteins
MARSALVGRGALAVGVGVAGFVVLFVLQGIPNRHSIEADLTGRSTKALRAAGLSTVDVSFVGRDGTVRARTAADASRALVIVRAQEGVRVASAIVLPGPQTAPVPSPSPSAAPSPSLSAPPEVQTQLTELPRITFETGNATLTPEGRTVVENVATILKSHPAVRVRIEGHTDSTGTPESNLVLSQARAETVRATLQSLGIASDRMTTAGFGDTRPLVPDNSPANQAVNRRVQFVVLP